MTTHLPLDHDAIAARIPHAGSMCLLDRVLSWDENHIECAGDACAGSADAPHPLADGGRLPATAAIEYAAQAMALHGSLLQERAASASGGRHSPPRRGFLAGLRSVRLHCRWIAADPPSLIVRVERFAGDDVQVLYDFDVRAAHPVAEGRAVVVLDAGARSGAPR